MEAATLKLKVASDGSKYLTGCLKYDLACGAILVLRKRTDGQWALDAVSGDGRRLNFDPQTLFAFCSPTLDSDLPRAKP